jgi:hypothetical protein
MRVTKRPTHALCTRVDAAELEETPSVVALGVDRSFTDFAERHGRYRHTENKGADLVAKCRGERLWTKTLMR